VIRTLVVDDDFRVSAIHAAYVSKVPGFEVAGQRTSVAAAVEAVHELRPDLLLLDVYLPDGSGLEVLRRLTADAPGDRPDALVITAARDLATVRTAMQLGATGYLVKPFGFAVLAERLDGYRALRERLAALDADGENGQAEVDALFSAVRPVALPAVPAKGHSAPTLSVVLAALRAETGDLSASQVAERTGVSRATAQRYLSYLVREGLVRLELRYGTTGRPEHRYRTA
jgi:response regulator of citrate/malate metabolism